MEYFSGRLQPSLQGRERRRFRQRLNVPSHVWYTFKQNCKYNFVRNPCQATFFIFILIATFTFQVPVRATSAIDVSATYKRRKKLFVAISSQRRRSFVEIYSWFSTNLRRRCDESTYFALVDIGRNDVAATNHSRWKTMFVDGTS